MLIKSLDEAYSDLQKAGGRVKGHTRKTKSGKMSFVQEHGRKGRPKNITIRPSDLILSRDRIKAGPEGRQKLLDKYTRPQDRIPYPKNLHKIAKEIGYDNDMPQRKKPDLSKIPIKWIPKIKIAERLASRLAGRSTRDVLGPKGVAELKRKYASTEIPKSEISQYINGSAISAVAMGEYETQRALIKKLGKDAVTFDRVVNSIFDGDLNQVFFTDDWSNPR